MSKPVLDAVLARFAAFEDALDAILARLAALEAALLRRERKRLSKADLARAKNCTPRNVMRMVEQKRLPPPDERDENGRLWWYSDNVERHRSTRERPDSAAARAAHNPQRHKPKPHPSPEV